MNEDGKLWYGVGLDTEQLKKDSEEAKAIFRGIGDNAVRSGEAGDQSYKQMSANMKQAIKEQKQLINEIKADIKSLQDLAKDPIKNKDAAGDLLGAKKALKEEQAALIGMQRQSIEMNTAETASQGGIFASLSKWAVGLMSVGVAMKIGKAIIESTEATTHMFERATAQATEGVNYFFKSIASGDFTNFIDGMKQAIKGAGDFVNRMEEINNLKNEQKVRSSQWDIFIGEARAESYSNDPKVVKAALKDIIYYQTQKLTEEADLKRKEYEENRRHIANKNAWNEKDLENTIAYYSANKKIIEEGERYNELTKYFSQKFGKLGASSQMSKSDIALQKELSSLNPASGTVAAKLPLVVFKERDLLADMLAKSQDAQAAININNRRDKQRLIGIEKQEETAAIAAAKKVTDEKNAAIKAQGDYTSEAGKRRIANAFEIEQKTLDLEQNGADKSRKQAELNFRKTLSDIEQQKQELIKKQNELSGGIDKKTGKPTATFNPILPVTDQSQLDQKTDIALQVYNATIKKGLDALLKEYATFEQKRAKIIKDGDDNIAQLAAANTNGQYTGNIEEVKTQTSEALSKLDKEIAARSKEYKLYVENIAKYALDRLNAELSATQHYLLSGETSEEQNAILRQEIEALQDQIKKLTGKTVKSKKDETLEMLNEINEATKNIISSFDDLDEGTKSILTAATNIAGGTIAMIKGIEALAVTGIEAIKGVERASVILTIIGAAFLIISAISNIFSTAKAEKYTAAISKVNDKVKELTDSYERLADAEATAQGVEKYSYTSTKIENLQAQIDKNNELIAIKKAQAEDDKDPRSGGGGLYSFLALPGWKNRQKANKDEIDELERQNRINSEIIAGMYNDMIESVIGTADDLASELSDAMFEAFSNGEDYAEAWGKKVDEIVGRIVKNMIVAEFITPQIKDIITEYSARWKDDKGNFDPNRFNQTAEDFGAALKSIGGGLQPILEMVNTYYPESGSKSSSSSSYSSRPSGFASMSQDTGSELNGRFTALQMSGVNIENHLLTLNGTASGMAGDIHTSTENIMNMKDAMLDCFSQLFAINKNTKELYEIKDELVIIRKNTSNM